MILKNDEFEIEFYKIDDKIGYSYIYNGQDKGGFIRTDVGITSEEEKKHYEKMLVGAVETIILNKYPPTVVMNRKQEDEFFRSHHDEIEKNYKELSQQLHDHTRI